jgi:hypothetical protein
MMTDETHALAVVNANLNARFKLIPRSQTAEHTDFEIELIDPVSFARYTTFLGADSEVEARVYQEKMRIEVTLQLAMHREVVRKLEEMLDMAGGDIIPIPAKQGLVS